MKTDKSNKEKVVYFVRHGQSEDNVTQVFQSPGSPLTDTGKEQAELIASRVSKLSFQKLISSPLNRATDTAKAISKITKKSVEYSELFVERIKPTSVFGKTHEDKTASTIYTAWEESLYTPGVKVEDGENYDEIIKRADKALKFLTDHSEKEIVVVTHGFFLKAVLARVLLAESLTPENFKNFQFRASTENSALSVIRYVTSDIGTRWRLWIYNDHAHLAD